ncbi:MAG: hypothetical protein U9Q92_05160 [archaeon]|nr:hypothetical protein [archaeon]
MEKIKYLTYGILILTVVGIILISGCTQEDSQTLKNTDCTKEGETPGATGCCEGLTAKTASEVNEATGECIDYWHLVCLKCGDGVCDDKYENYCNCQQDCKREIDCITEGQINYFGDPPCCEGLNQISNAAPMKEDCIARPDGSGYCTKCGDGMCKSPENKCNCPEDCPSKCAGEGESVPVVLGAPECCEGLTKIGCEKPDNNGICPTEPCVGASICAKCGNGVCGNGENKCNCPEDCS